MSSRAERAVSFGTVARDYDRYRMTPPTEAVDWLLPAGCTAVLDLGAGTGLLTRRLAERLDDVTAVDPDARMREVLAEQCPGVTVHEGTGERIPLPDSRVDAVLVSSAWHWMDPALALPEIARVLRPGGTFGVLYNRRDHRVDWVGELDQYVVRLTTSENQVEHKIHQLHREGLLPENSPFGPVSSHVFTWQTSLTVDAVVGMYTTYTRYIEQSDERKQELKGLIEARVRELAVMADGQVQMPMACHCWRTEATT